MPRTASAGSTTTRIIAAAPLRITKKVTTQIVRSLHDQLSKAGRSGTIRSIRFIPSSRSVTASGAFQVVAHTIIEHGTASEPRPEPLESIVTVGRVGGSQTLEELKIPALRHGGF